VPRIGILRTSPFGNSRKFGFMILRIHHEFIGVGYAAVRR
jgi:hypothetical protein